MREEPEVSRKFGREHELSEHLVDSPSLTVELLIDVHAIQEHAPRIAVDDIGNQQVAEVIETELNLEVDEAASLQLLRLLEDEENPARYFHHLQEEGVLVPAHEHVSPIQGEEGLLLVDGSSRIEERDLRALVQVNDPHERIIARKLVDLLARASLPPLRKSSGRTPPRGEGTHAPSSDADCV